MLVGLLAAERRAGVRFEEAWMTCVVIAVKGAGEGTGDWIDAP